MSELIQKLDETIKGSNWDKVVSIAEQILSSSPNDKDVLQSYFISLLHLGYFNRIENDTRCEPFMKSYCLYKEKRFEDSIIQCNSLENTTITLNIRAQSLFKLHRFNDAIKIYESLMNSMANDEELVTNLIACYVMNGQYDNALKILEQNKGGQCETFELTYNGACAAAAKGDWTLAMHLLRSAQSTAEDAGLTTEDLEDELAPIRVMLAYVLQQEGGRERGDEAHELYKLVADGKTRDKVAPLIASSNLVPLQGKHGLYDALKRLEKGWSSQEYTSLLTPQQRQAVGFNYAVVLLRLKKLEQCGKVVEELIREFPQWTLPVVLSSALQRQQGNVEGAIAALQRVVATGNAEDGIRRALAQLLHGAGKLAEALRVLGSLGRPGPSDVQCMISWAHHSGVALDQHVVNRVADPKERAALLEVCARAKAREADFRGAADDFAAALKLDPQRTSALAGFVSAASQFDAAKAEAAAEALPAVEGIMDVDVDALENRLLAAQGPAVVSVQAVSTTTTPPPTSSAAPSDTDTVAAPVVKQWKRKQQQQGSNKSTTGTGKKKQRKRAPKKAPKDLDKPVDLERWLPMKDRSYYVAPIKKKVKVKGVKGRIGGAGGHQGGATAESAAALDLSTKKDAVSSSSKSPAAVPSTTTSSKSPAAVPSTTTSSKSTSSSNKAPGKKKGR